MSKLPEARERNAMYLPSGDHDGIESSTVAVPVLAKNVWLLPSAFMVNRSS
jgi:hypothetical protein